MYDPALGRFHTIDPLAEWDLKTSPYVYVGNNPILYIDPDGMRRTKEERLKDREERRQKREKRWAEKRGTKYIKPVNCYAKDGSKKSTSRKNNNIGFFNPVHGINWTTSVDLFGRSGTARKGDGSAESENIDAWLLNANLSVVNLHMPFGNAMQRMLTIALGAFNIAQKIGTEIEKIISDKEIMENNIGDDSPQPNELLKVKPPKNDTITLDKIGLNDSLFVRRGSSSGDGFYAKYGETYVQYVDSTYYTRIK